jgi:hypothetical protein
MKTPSDHYAVEIEFLEAFAKLRKPIIGFVVLVRLSVCPHGTNRLPLDGFPLNLIFEQFLKIRPENSSFILQGHSK